MAAPGGFIFVTKGLVKRCGDEETLAAILAHEIGHVAARHGLQSIKKSRLIDAFKVIGSEASQRLDSEELTKITGIFEGVLGDVVETLVERGYDRKFEYEADKLGLTFAVRTGYAPGGLAEFLVGMEERKPSGPAAGWFKTHPSPADRLARVKTETAALGAAPAKLDVRTARFTQAVKNLR
jgi:predicted Zn-dependent protease